MYPSSFKNLENFLDVDEKFLNLRSYHCERKAHREPNAINGSEQNDDTPQSSKDEGVACYWPLYKLIQKKDWGGVEAFVRKNGDALTARIDNEETLIDLLIRFGDSKANWLIDRLVTGFGLPVARQNLKGGTTLTICAASGNLEAIKILVTHDPDLPNERDKDGLLPVHYAALYGQKDTFQFLLLKTAVGIYSGDDGAQLLVRLIYANFYDIALDLLNSHPAIGRDDILHRAQILDVIAEKPLAFKSGRRLGRLKRLIYNSIPVKNVASVQANDNQCAEGDIETGCVEQITFVFGTIRHKLLMMLWNDLKHLGVMLWNALMCLDAVPVIRDMLEQIKDMREQKIRHNQAVEIVRILCEGVIWTNPRTRELLTKAFFKAARLGISEFVNEIFKAYEGSVYWKNREGYTIFHVAVIHRRAKIFNLIHSSNFKLNWLGVADKSGNNILHFAGTLVPSSEVAGAALQMQRELQWFKAVEKLVHPSFREIENKEKQTPREVFTKEHIDLVKKGEKWMKGTASSCSVVAALIITVVFAASFNVPGGMDSVGKPKLLHKPAFIIFAISDGFALISSIYSVLMLLGVLTSRYAEDDFLVSAPEKLIKGLRSLLFSIATMMVAFGAAIYLNLYRKWKLVFIPIGIFGCFPVIWFAVLQLPLFLDMYSSTYGRGIFAEGDGITETYKA